MQLEADVLILGGGCAGLSLATALAERAPRLRVQILEPRTRYERDRTWCFWNTEPHPFAAGVTHRWHSWQLKYDGADVRQRSSRYSYEHLPADCFYEIAGNAVRKAGYVLSMGVEAQTIERRDGHCLVETTDGALRSRWVFDSRPPTHGAVAPALVQRFVGWQVQTEQPCFDPSVVDLMDFQCTDAAGRTTFFYVLPFSATEALVEATFLDDPAMPPADGEGILREYLERLSTGGYQVVYSEGGALPMGGSAPATKSTSESIGSKGQIVQIGTRGGRVKPSSGYAFMRMQRQSAALAQALMAGTELPSRFEPPFYRLLDAIFLRALKRAPERVPTYFMALFSKLPADLLVRFLSETAAPAEVARVMLALPKLDFMQAAFLPGKGLPA